jgi:hypothetical protein
LIASAKRLLQQNLPLPDSCGAAKMTSLDDLVGDAERRWRDGEAKQLGTLDVDDKLRTQRNHSSSAALSILDDLLCRSAPRLSECHTGNSRLRLASGTISIGADSYSKYRRIFASN